MANEINIAAWLLGEGFETAESQRSARALLEARGLTRAGRVKMAADKVALARGEIARLLVKSCGDPGCDSLAPDCPPVARQLILAASQVCEVCGGSNAKRAALLMIRACKRAGVDRLLIIGGTPVQHRDLARLTKGAVEFRFVVGDEGNPNKRHAITDLNWAQFMVVWASTPLPHRVSTPYTDERPTSLPAITVARRGVEALCDEVTEALRRLRPEKRDR